jgi:hypothetical protein
MNLFDITIDRGEMYRAAVFPEMFPEERPMRVDNWPAEDREAYCGGEFTRGR